jgi:SAM-dependent methyltransferase
VSDPDPAELREQQLQSWERAARGWGRRADAVRDFGLPVSAWLLEHLALAPGERVLELAAGPGDTGFMAAELIRPGGTLISSDASEAMLSLARERAAAQGVENVEFKTLQLEWIDLEAASVDAIVCRWGVMLTIDPAAALKECRRVLRPGGRIALAVWDLPERNPWATVPQAVLTELGLAPPPPDARAPGQFALSAPGQLRELLDEAGFLEPLIEPVDIERAGADAEDFLDATLDLSQQVATLWSQLSDSQQAELVRLLNERLAPFTDATGAVRIPGRAVCALAHA